MDSMLSALFTAYQVAPYLLAFLLGIAIPALGVVCYWNFAAGLTVTSVMFSLETLYRDVGGVHIGISIYYTDIVLLFIAVIAALRVVAARDVPRRHAAWMLYALAFVISLVVGLINYGAGAGVQARAYFYSVAVGSYAMSFRIEPRHVKAVVTAFASLSLLFIGVCVYRWIVYYTPIPDLLPPEGNYNPDGAIRVIKSNEALILAQALVVGLFFAGISRSALLARIASPPILGVVLALQHRSVWLATLVGILAAVFVARSRDGSRVGQLLLAVAIVSVTSLPLALSDRLSGLSGQVSGAAERAVDAQGSVGERVDNWKGLIQLWAATPRSILVGQSFGSDSTRYVQDHLNGGEHKITYFAHNHYVQTLYNLGLVGIVAFLAVQVYAVNGLYRLCANGHGEQTAALLLVLVLMQAAYYVPYGTDYFQSAILGVAIAFVATRQRLADDEKRGSAPAGGKRPARGLGAGWGWA